MRKINSTPDSSHNVAEIQNSNLRTKGIKSIGFKAEKLDSSYLNLIGYGMEKYDELLEKYKAQDRRTGFNVLLKALGVSYNIDQYLNASWIIPYFREDSSTMVFVYDSGVGSMNPFELKRKILTDFLRPLAYENRRPKVKYRDEDGMTHFLNGIRIYESTKIIETEDGVYAGPVFISEDGESFLCSKKYFFDHLEQEYVTSIKTKSQKKEKDSYQEIFRMYQAIKLGDDKVDISKLKDMAKDLKAYIATLPEVTYLGLTDNYLTIKLGWRWISDNQMRYTPRYVPPITLQYDFRDKNFYHKGSTNHHPHCISSGNLCTGDMGQRMFNNIQEDFYIGIVKSMYEFGMTWSSDDAAGTTRMPQYCIKNYLEDKNIDELTDENIMLIINECRYYNIIDSYLFRKIKKRAEAILGGEIDMRSLIQNNHGKGKYFLIDSEEETPEIKIKEQPTQTIDIPEFLVENDNEDDRYEP